MMRVNLRGGFVTLRECARAMVATEPAGRHRRRHERLGVPHRSGDGALLGVEGRARRARAGRGARARAARHSGQRRRAGHHRHADVRGDRSDARLPRAGRGPRRARPGRFRGRGRPGDRRAVHARLGDRPDRRRRRRRVARQPDRPDGSADGPSRRDRRDRRRSCSTSTASCSTPRSRSTPPGARRSRRTARAPPTIEEWSAEIGTAAAIDLDGVARSSGRDRPVDLDAMHESRRRAPRCAARRTRSSGPGSRRGSTKPTRPGSASRSRRARRPSGCSRTSTGSGCATGSPRS